MVAHKTVIVFLCYKNFANALFSYTLKVEGRGGISLSSLVENNPHHFMYFLCLTTSCGGLYSIFYTLFLEKMNILD